MKLSILKCHGSANDFVLVDERSVPLPDSVRERFVRSACDRAGVLGADGVLFVGQDADADARMRMFNPDGTEAEMCGNGLRCVSRLILDERGAGVVRVRTAGGIFAARRSDRGPPDVAWIEAEMGRASFAPEAVGLSTGEEFVDRPPPGYATGLRFTAVSVLNPHFVAVVGRIARDELARIGTAVNQRRDLFPRGANVSFATVESPDRLFVATWERGAGPTLSCGSGMTAATLVASRLGRVESGRTITVESDGGLVECRVDRRADGWHASLTGNATWEFHVAAEIAPDGTLVALRDRVDHDDDVAAYDEFAMMRSLPR